MRRRIAEVLLTLPEGSVRALVRRDLSHRIGAHLAAFLFEGAPLDSATLEDLERYLHPRHVPEDLVLLALETFFRTGERTRCANWARALHSREVRPIRKGLAIWREAQCAGGSLPDPDPRSALRRLAESGEAGAFSLPLLVLVAEGMFRRGETQQAREVYERGLESFRTPDLVGPVLVRLGEIWIVTGRAQDAPRAVLEGLALLDPEFPPAVPFRSVGLVTLLRLAESQTPTRAVRASVNEALGTAPQEWEGALRYLASRVELADPPSGDGLFGRATEALRETDRFSTRLRSQLPPSNAGGESMIGLLDLGGRGLVGAAIERSEEAVVVLPRLEAALASTQATELDALIVETDELDAGVRELLFAAANRSVPILVVSRDRSVAAAVEALQGGATDYLCSPFEYETLQRAWTRLLGACGARPPLAGETDPFLTNDPETRATLELARSVAASDATILIEGESGTGKELLARLIHRASPRRERPLVSVNCAALPSGLLESELFGHERGAFTGAVSRVIGKFELAHGTTLLLDEIGELELGLQAKLLRVLQEKEVQRISAPRPVRVDFRLVVTTNRDLAAEVRANRFREDLFYRLQVIPVRLKPLRERPDDVPPLVDHFLREHACRKRSLPVILPEAVEMLRARAWPGNVRELENLIERLVLTRPEQTVGREDLGLPAELPILSSEPSPAPELPPVRTIREMERWMIFGALKRLDGNRTRAARELGISLRTLRNKINEYEIFDPETLPRAGTPRAARWARRGGQISPGAS
jgi:two-component system response regulator FlrC